MIIRSPEPKVKILVDPEVKILVDRDPIKTSFEQWAKPGHFSRTIAKGPDTTTWIWNLHADAHDFDSHTSDLEEISRKVFSAHFGQLSIIFLWLSGMYFHGARFSNYEAWLNDPTHIRPSAQVVWPIVGQEILNGDVGGGFRGIQITSGFFQIWRASGITSELQLYCTAIGALVFAALMLFAGWFHYHKAAPKLAWFQDVESMLNHHLAGLLGLGSLSWAGHQVHVSLPINQFLNAGVDPKEIPLPHEFILNRDLLAQLYPSFAEGATPFFTLNWSKYADFLTFRGGLDPLIGGLWLTDIAHHHLAIAILFLIAGHMYRTNWGIGHGIKDILEAHKGPFTGQGLNCFRCKRWIFYIHYLSQIRERNKTKLFIDIYDMFLMVTGFMNYGQQTVRAARYIGQSFMIILSHANRLPVTIQYPYEKLITSERFRGRIHFEFDKCIACEVCVRVCPIDLPVVDWKMETDIRKKRLLNYSIDFGICIFCGNCIEYCPTNCLSMTEEYELSTYDRHELNYNQIALGRLPMSIIDDYTIRTIQIK
ncbi:hypothetical protein RYX36_025805 [Vicia faba]